MPTPHHPPQSPIRETWRPSTDHLVYNDPSIELFMNRTISTTVPQFTIPYIDYTNTTNDGEILDSLH